MRVTGTSAPTTFPCVGYLKIASVVLEERERKDGRRDEASEKGYARMKASHNVKMQKERER
jgi:hypothetical protein